MQYLRTTLKAAGILALAAFANFSQAAIISVAPQATPGLVGEAVFVDLVWDGTAGPSYIGGVDLDVFFDDSILTFTDAVLDPDDGFGDDLSGTTVIFPFLTNVFNLSFEFPGDLIGIQDGLGNVFTIATLEFTAISEGVSDIVLFPFTGFADEEGLLLDVELVDGSVTVPEPGVLPLMGLSLLALAYARRRRS